MLFSRYFYISLLSTFTLCAAPFCPEAAQPTLQFPPQDFQNSNVKLKEADEYFEAALHTKSIDAYKNLIRDLATQPNNPNDQTGHNLLIQTRFHLAQAYFSLEKYQDAASAIEDNTLLNPLPFPSSSEQIRRHSIYLKALILKNLKQYASVKKTLISYLELTPPDLNFRDEAQFELGLLDFIQQDFPKAAAAFMLLKVEKTKPQLYLLSELFLARIAQQQGHFKEADSILESLGSKISKDEPLRFEWSYLRGEIAFEMQQYSKAIQFLKEALSPEFSEKQPWYTDTLYHLGWSYLKIGDEVAFEQDQKVQYLQKAQETFKTLFSIAPKEEAVLALAQCYLSQANHLKQSHYYTKAEELLSKSEYFSSKDGQAQALLLRAEATPTYAARDQFYRELTEKASDSGLFYANGWYMRGLNDFENGRLSLESQNYIAAQNSFERSIEAFKKAFDLLKEKDLPQAGAALKYRALATGYSNESEADPKALKILETLISDYPDIWESMPNKDEIYYLQGYYAGRSAKNDAKSKHLEVAEQSLQAAASVPNGTFGDQALNNLGALYYAEENYSKAEEAYLQLTSKYPLSPLAGEAWLWSACCADHLQADGSIGKERRRQAYERHPNSPSAAESFFTSYTYPEYLQGDKSSIKHLQSFTERFAATHFLIDAHYLIGLDYKRDRKTPEGRWIRKKSLTEAIDSFQKAEIVFDELSEKNLIPVDKLNYYTAMGYRATLERAMINLKIAEEAYGAKKQIYLDYAEEVFKNLSQELHSGKSPYVQRLYQENTYPLIDEETSFWLAQTYIKGSKDEEADRILSGMIDLYKKNNTAKGYYLARSFDEQGKIALRSQDYPKALQQFKNAEEAAKGNVLSTDQKLELWIQQSLCYRGLGQYDDAVLILSKVINDDAVSALRMKAMYLRAETYEQEKRPDLARKQLESMVKKGGIWARKAQEKLDKDDLSNGH